MQNIITAAIIIIGTGSALGFGWAEYDNRFAMVPSAHVVIFGARGNGFEASPSVDRVTDLEHDREIRCLALNGYHEARGESRTGEAAVAHVVLARMRSPRWPDDVCAVVYQGPNPGGDPRKCQFSWTCDGLSDEPRDVAAWRRSIDIAADVVAGRAADVTGGADHYHADHVEPFWAGGMNETAQIGSHRFYVSG